MFEKDQTKETKLGCVSLQMHLNRLMEVAEHADTGNLGDKQLDEMVMRIVNGGLSAVLYGKRLYYRGWRQPM